MIPYGRQSIDQEDIEAVLDILRSDWLTQGPAIDGFEKALSDRCKSQFAVSFSSATGALHAAYSSLEIGPGKLVWTSPNTFVATANAALYLGADVDFVDIDNLTKNLCAQKLEEKIIATQRRGGKLPDLVVPVHFAGQPCDMESIAALAKKYSFRVVEDASHAVGGVYKGRPIGACDYSDICVFSFHPVKIITTGEGGAALTNSKSLAKKLSLFRTHGINRDASTFIAPGEGEWYYEQVSLGFNYRITDIQAALGTSQLKKIDKFIDRRRILVKRYQEKLSALPGLILPQEIISGSSAWHLYSVNFSSPSSEQMRKHAYRFFRQNGIGVNVHYIPVPSHPFYRDRGFHPELFPQALNHYQTSLSLPLYYELSDSDQDYVIELMKTFFSEEK